MFKNFMSQKPEKLPTSVIDVASALGSSAHRLWVRDLIALIDFVTLY